MPENLNKDLNKEIVQTKLTRKKFVVQHVSENTNFFNESLNKRLCIVCKTYDCLSVYNFSHVVLYSK